MGKPQKSLMFAGWATLGLLAVMILIIFALHQLQIVNAWMLPLQPISLFLLCGSGACFVFAKVRSGAAGTNSNLYRWRQKLFYCCVLLLVSVNVLSYVAAYGVTHVRNPGQGGLGFPKPMNLSTPADRGLSYTSHRLDISPSAWLDAWLMPTTTESQGTVVLFPGNRSTKDRQLIGPAQSFTQLGYDALLIDYQGMGGSSGQTTTVGMHEAQDVAVAVKSIDSLNLEPPVILYGASMGSAAILRAIATTNLQPAAIILELPFARFIDAVRSRLRRHQIPAFPTAELLLFWGGVQHGVNGFGHNPVEFAKSVNCPTLVIQGQQDPWTTVAEVQELFQNLPQPKKLVISPDGGHHQLIGVDKPLWDVSITTFLRSL